VTRIFRARDGREWTVRWSAEAHASSHGNRVEIRPPGLWFETAALRQRFLFHPGGLTSELATMSEERLRQWLARADAPD
jgi:hypothetical protein